MTNEVRNPYTAQGAFGERFVSLRLWQFGIDVARFQTDTGVDCVAAGHGIACLLQVKTTRKRTPIQWPDRHFDVLAVVRLPEDSQYFEIGIGDVELFLIPATSHDGSALQHGILEGFRVEDMVPAIWGEVAPKGADEPVEPDQATSIEE